MNPVFFLHKNDRRGRKSGVLKVEKEKKFTKFEVVVNNSNNIIPNDPAPWFLVSMKEILVHATCK